jgi:hypothetical protein
VVHITQGSKRSTKNNIIRLNESKIRAGTWLAFAGEEIARATGSGE